MALHSFLYGTVHISPCMKLVSLSQHEQVYATENADQLCPQQERIWNYAQAIAATYPDTNRATYISAARTLRVPFWDWALEAKLPLCMTTPLISINTPTGLKTLINPLYSHLFRPSISKGFPDNDPVSISCSLIYSLIVIPLLSFNFSLLFPPPTTFSFSVFALGRSC